MSAKTTPAAPIEATEVEPLEKGFTAIATNGKRYKIVDSENKKVRAVKPRYSLENFETNLTESELPEAAAENNTKILHKFLASHFEGVDMRNGYVRWAGFKICYNGFGFEIRDDWNFGKAVNINKYHNDFAAPEDVYEYLKGKDKREIQESEEKKVVDLTRTSLEAAGFKVKESDEAKDLREKHEARVEAIEAKKAAKPTRAPKFIEPTLIEPTEIKPMPDGRLLITSKGPGKRWLEHEMHYHELLVNQVLATAPKAMALIMKVAQGEEFDIVAMRDSGKLDRKFVRDPFQHYDRHIVRDTAHASALIALCREILAAQWVTDPTTWVYGSDMPELTKGAKVRVYWPDHHSWFTSKVVNVDGCIKILYAEGGVDRLFKHQNIIVL